MAAMKKLFFLVENTAAMRVTWTIIFLDYLEKLIRLFAGIKAREEAGPDYEIAVVKFNGHGAYEPDACLVEPGIRSNYDDYFTTLSSISFTGGEFQYAATAEGLAEVLMMIASDPTDQIEQNDVFQRHCILVAASNPYPLRTSVYLPPDNMSETISTNAETIARSFSKYFVSLSVLCPQELPKLRAVYNAGKMNPFAADHTINISTNPNHMILISQDFIDACPDVSESGITILPPSFASTSDSPPGPFILEPLPTSYSPPGPGYSDPIMSWSELESILWPPTTAAEVDTQPLQNSQQDDHSVLTCITVPSPPLRINDNLQQGKAPVTGSVNPHLLNNIAASSLAKVKDVISTGTMMASASTMSTVASASTMSMMASASSMSMMASASSMSPQVQAEPAMPLASAPRFVKLWEGELFCRKKGQLVLVSRLKGYREGTSLASLAEGWPTTMQVDKLMFPDDLHRDWVYNGSMDYLFFEAMNDHAFFRDMRRCKLFTFVVLPSHVLLLSSSPTHANRLMGWLYPGNALLLKPRPSRPQLPSQQQQQVSSEAGPSGARQVDNQHKSVK